MIIVVDTGGTKTAISSFGDGGGVSDYVKFPTPKPTDEYINLVSHEIKNIIKDHPAAAICVALPGTVQNGSALWCKNLGWHNFEVSKKLKRHFPKIPIFTENDANLAGLSEASLNKTEHKKSLYITISTGIGTGFVQNGEIIPYLQTSEGGQILVNYDDTLQKWEDFASGRAIYNRYGKLGCDIHDEATWREIAKLIVTGLYTIIPLVQPEVIIFGGSMGAYTEKFKDILDEMLDKNLPPHILRPATLKAVHPEHAVLFGGYKYALNQLAN